MAYKSIHTIRYMGNKAKLLDFVIPKIESLTNPGDVICDLMAGTSSIGYALKLRNPIIANDVQYYSCVISDTMLNLTEIPSEQDVKKELKKFFDSNMKNQYEKYYFETYGDTYFSPFQCLEIDSFVYAIKKSGIDTNIYSVHKLRHTAATLMYKYGNVDIRNLQLILGHQSVSTTQIYTHLDNASLREAARSNPIGHIKHDDINE